MVCIGHALAPFPVAIVAQSIAAAIALSQQALNSSWNATSVSCEDADWSRGGTFVQLQKHSSKRSFGGKAAPKVAQEEGRITDKSGTNLTGNVSESSSLDAILEKVTQESALKDMWTKNFTSNLSEFFILNTSLEEFGNESGGAAAQVRYRRLQHTSIGGRSSENDGNAIQFEAGAGGAILFFSFYIFGSMLLYALIGEMHGRRFFFAGDITDGDGGRGGSIVRRMHSFADNVGRDEQENRGVEMLPFDIFGAAISSAIRDMHFMASYGRPVFMLRCSRLVLHILVCMLCQALQLGIVVCVKLFVTPPQVEAIRGAYNAYEIHMYENHTVLNQHGYALGMEQHFRPELFLSLPKKEQTDVCNIPFSEKTFLLMVLIVWTGTCSAHIKQIIEQFDTLVLATPTIASMEDSLLALSEDGASVTSEPLSRVASRESDTLHKAANYQVESSLHKSVCVGLVFSFKVGLTCCILLPRLLTTILLLWLGCRWLVATNSFGDFVANAVALEFILLKKDLIYNLIISQRSARNLQHTYILPQWKYEPASYMVFFTNVWYAICTLAWVWLYVYKFQSVLVGYKWDLNMVCSKYHWHALYGLGLGRY